MRVPIIDGAVRNSLLRILSCLVAAASLLSFNLQTAHAQNGCGNSGCAPTAVDPGPRPGPQPNTGAGHPAAGQVCSEANSVVTAFNNLTQSQQQDLITFLRSL
jgi:hypothetical protein